MLSEVRRRIRQRQLAGDGRAGSWARTKARRRQWMFVRKQWRFFVGTALGAAVFTSLVLVLVRAEFVRGLIVGAAVAGTIGALAMLVLLVTGTGPISMGATAEQWTASELRPLKRAGWRVMNHVALQAWDIDHVLVGPGGVIAVETKWSSSGWTLNPPDAVLSRAIEQVTGNARSLRLWKDLRLLGVDSVTPVVFLWGNNQERSQIDHIEPQQIREVTVIHGVHAARAWRSTLQARPNAPAHDAVRVQQMWDALEKQVRTRDRHIEATSAPAPPTLGWIYWTALSVVLATIGAFIGALQALRLGTWWGWSAVIIVETIVGVYARRIRSLRFAALGWLAGIGAAALLVAVLAAL